MKFPKKKFLLGKKIRTEEGNKTRVKKKKQKQKAIEPIWKWTSMGEKHKKIKEKKRKEWEHKKTWGDELQQSSKWPGQTEAKTIRLYSHNTNGISCAKNYFEWEMMLDYLEEHQVDVAGLCEVNLDLTQKQIQYELRQRAKKMDKHIGVSMSSSKEKVKDTAHKMGGTLTLIRGNYSGRLVEQGQDKLGRWSYMVLTGKNENRIKIITTYRVGKNKADSGNCTIRLQQERDLLQETGKLLNPREILLRDLEKVITTAHEKSERIILMGDMNEDMEKGERIGQFLEATGLKNIHHECHDKLQLPATYDRGKVCLDMIAMSKSIPTEAVKRSRILPFYSGYPSDHRALYADIDADSIFTNVHADVMKSTYKRFTTDKVKNVDKYIFTLETKLEEARIFRKIDILEKK